MKGQEKPKGHNNRRGNGKGSRLKPFNFILKTVIVLVGIGVAAGLVYAMFFISSLSSIATEISKGPNDVSNSPKTYKITQNLPPEEKAQPLTQTAQSVATPPPSNQTMKSNAVSVAEPNESDPAMDFEMEEAASEAFEDEEDIPPEVAAMEFALQELKDALPDNILIPTEKSEMEIDDLISAMEEQQVLQELVDQDNATVEQRQRYYDLMSKPLEDEKELIHYCSQVVANSGNMQDPANGLCAQVAADADARLGQLDDQLEELRQQLR